MKEKTLKSLLLFLLLSLILVTIFSLVYWFEYRNNLDELDYIGNPSWEEPQILVSELYTDSFSVVNEKDNFNLFYIDKNPDGIKETLYINQYNLKGELKDKEKFKEAQSLNYFTTINDDEFTHLFTIEGEKDSEQELIYYKLDNENNIEEKKVILSDLSYTISLISRKFNNDFYIGLTADKENKNYIELVKFDKENNNILKSSRIEYSDDNQRLGVRYPEFVFKDNKIYLSYLREDPSKLFSSTSDKTNKRELVLEVVNDRFEILSNEKQIIDRAFKRDKNSKPVMVLNNNYLHIYYHHYNLDERKLYMNKAAISLENNKLENIQKYEDNTIAAIDHLKKNDKHYLVYNKFENINSSLYLSENESLQNNDPGNILFSQYKMSYNPKISTNEEGLQLVWSETNNNRKDLYYSTNIGSRKAGFWEIIGLNVSGESSVFFIAPIYFLALPVLSVIRNFHIIFAAGMVLILLYIMANRFNLSGFKNKLDNVYISYILIMIVFGIIAYFITIPEYFFFPDIPLNKYIPYIFGAAFVAVLIMLSRSEIDTEASPFLAIAGVTLWMYWVAQINLVFSLSYYFF